MLVRAVDGGVHADGPVDLTGSVRVGEDLPIDQIPRAVLTEPAMTFPYGLPRPELCGQITPWRTCSIAPHDPFKHPPVLLERTPTLPRHGRHQRLDPSPSSIRKSASTRHSLSLPSTSPEVRGHALVELVRELDLL